MDSPNINFSTCHLPVYSPKSSPLLLPAETPPPGRVPLLRGLRRWAWPSGAPETTCAVTAGRRSLAGPLSTWESPCASNAPAYTGEPAHRSHRSHRTLLTGRHQLQTHTHNRPKQGRLLHNIPPSVILTHMKVTFHVQCRWTSSCSVHNF